MREVRLSYLEKRNLPNDPHLALANLGLGIRFSDFKALLCCFTGTTQKEQELSESF